MWFLEEVTFLGNRVLLVQCSEVPLTDCGADSVQCNEVITLGVKGIALEAKFLILQSDGRVANNLPVFVMGQLVLGFEPTGQIVFGPTLHYNEDSATRSKTGVRRACVPVLHRLFDDIGFGFFTTLCRVIYDEDVSTLTNDRAANTGSDVSTTSRCHPLFNSLRRLVQSSFREDCTIRRVAQNFTNFA